MLGFSPERLELPCLAGGDLTTGVKADAKARAKAEVDASCRDKTQAHALATADALVGEVPFEISRYFRVAVFLMCLIRWSRTRSRRHHEERLSRSGRSGGY